MVGVHISDFQCVKHALFYAKERQRSSLQLKGPLGREGSAMYELGLHIRPR